MLFKIRTASQACENEVTPREFTLSRRTLVAGAAAVLATSGVPLFPSSASAATFQVKTTIRPEDQKLDEVTPLKAVSNYNNFTEFGPGKTDPARNAGTLPLRPWAVVIDGEVAKPMTFALEDLLALPLEERIYRHRCVEGWSMVIPWVGFPLSALLKRAEPTGSAKYVAFQTLHDPKHMPGQRLPVLEWPYKEGLRLDEAMNPLAIMGVGMYGEVMPNQNGAPIRLVTPWKYGYKSIKSVVRITLTREQPPTIWNIAQPDEYGFYANVNPEVDHPRWSQATERRVGEFFRRKTKMFNGYAEEVASLYTGMNLQVNY